MEWMLRPLFGLILAGIAIAALIGGGGWFATFIGLGTVAAAREWHRLVSRAGYRAYLAITAVAIGGALALPVLHNGAIPAIPAPYGLSLALIGLCTLADGLLGLARRDAPLWQASGPLYLAIPGLALFALRATPDHGLWLVLLLFVSVWGCDTGALVSGKLIGGPKLVPRLSPNKTWAGFTGGTLAAAIAASAVMAGLGDDVWRGALFGAIIALISHAGDMFESWVKRRVGRKDSGSLIPGHGGVLDRIDSILFAASACAAFVFAFGAHAIFGGAP